MSNIHSPVYASRLAAVKGFLHKKKLKGFLVTNLENIRYLSGFTGSSAMLFISPALDLFITDFRYKEQAEKEIGLWDLIISKGGLWKTAATVLKRNRLTNNVGFETSVSYEAFLSLSKTGIQANGVSGFIEKIRAVKDAHELRSIAEAVSRAESAYKAVRPYIRKGISEKAVALRLEQRLKGQGCEKIPFDIIVASGPNSAMPHAKPSTRKIQPGDFVVIDWGGEANGYFSDMTRTLIAGGGKEIPKKKAIYSLVLQANRKGIASVRAGVKAREVDSAARSFISGAGYGEYFGHGTGHGVGMQVHELPNISWKSSEKIRAGMVFTIEPGIYLPGLGGVRIEDMVISGEQSAGILTTLPKEIEII
jgi:Xaa-Pro aminopeptidase